MLEEHAAAVARESTCETEVPHHHALAGNKLSWRDRELAKGAGDIALAHAFSAPETTRPAAQAVKEAPKRSGYVPPQCVVPPLSYGSFRRD